MGGYISTTERQRADMLAAVGVPSLNALYADLPQASILPDGPDIPSGKSELEVRRFFEALAGKNKRYGSIFRGAGAYNHYIPAIVSEVVGKETFVTAYTPYQAEISQGILQSIFEYQTMICSLTDMDVSNASVYDGATAAAEALAMCRDRKRSKALVSACVHPDTLETMRTYCWASGTELVVIPEKDGRTDIAALIAMADGETASVFLQQPNYYGLIEEAEKIGEAAHDAGAKFIMGVNPIAAALIKSPGECGADIAVGDGQPLGMPLSFGGPYLGFMAAKTALMRKLPGRIAGETTDAQGNRAFVLTLQAREQHIRREKASSNICSNQALCAMTAACYMAAMGPEGMREAARQSYAKAHYLEQKLTSIEGISREHKGEFFHEFVLSCPVEPQKILDVLSERNMLGGLQLGGMSMLWCATEMNTREEIDALAEVVGKVVAG